MSERTAMRIGLPAGVAGWIVAAVFLWRTSVPSLSLSGFDADRDFSPALLRRAHDYGDGARLLWLLGTLAALAALGVLAWRLPRSARRLGLGRVSSGIVVGMVVVATLWLVALPFSVATLWWQHHYGLGPFDVWGWLAAQRAQLGASALFALVEVSLVMALAVRLPRGWWLPGAAAFVGLTALLAFVSGWLGALGSHPVRDPELRADVARLEAAEGVRPPVRVLEVSDWTDLPNAFTAGYGPSTRVVLWDTIVDGRFSRGEVAVVVAHELGHARSRHIPKGIAWYALFAVPAALVVAAATRPRGGLRDPANVPLAALVLTVLGLAWTPLQNAVVRRYEAEADWRALLATDDPAAARRLFDRFVPTTLEEPNPPGWDYAFLQNHPTIAQRLAMVDAFRRLRDRP
ncbi:MAG TPA: M48 family metalloprotease [Gaiellaceae bacterium]|nr:M48 family metalloprotease [Gaiellaceae bacterium]